MKLAGTKWSALCAGLLPLLVLTGCGSSDDDSGNGASPTGAGGSTGGSGGSGGSAGGSAGASGKAGGSGGSAGGSAGMSGGAGAAGKSGGGGAGGAGGSAGGAGGSSGGSAGGGGGVSPGGVPTTCEAAHGSTGCCFEGNAYYYSSGDVTMVDCKQKNQVCAWTGTYYDCADTASADPSGKFPVDCGGPNLPDSGCTGAGGSGGAPAHNSGACCAAADSGTGCGDSTIETCVCAKDDYCCTNSWDSTCAKEVQQFGCGFCTPECTTSADCAKTPDSPACDPGVKHCVECVEKSDCVTAKKGNSCNTTTHTCVECGADADCAGSTNGTVCDAMSGKCVECNTNAECASSPNGKICNTKSHVCTECGADADCAGSKNGSKCNVDKGVCVQCAADADCKDKAGLPLCNTGTGLCVPNCCAAGADGTMGCAGDKAIETCVCAKDDYCCTTGWDSTCAAEVEQFGCGFCTAACSSSADCSGSPATPACDGTSKHCVECVANADCAGNKNGPACDTMKHACVECTNNADCAGSKNGSICDTTKNACVECASDTDCSSSPNGKFCSNAQTCVACKSDFDCTDPKAPSCVADPTSGKLGCGTSAECTGDDAAENSDDGPSGATDLTPDASGTKTIDNHSVCGQPSSEADFYKVTVNDGDNLDVSVSWTDSMADIDVYALDSKGNTLGLNYFQTPATIKLTYLPKGTVYLMVNRFDGQAPSPAATPYKITATVKGGNKCATSADCAAEYNTQLLRGSCNTGTGACESIDGKGAVAEGAACDSGDDCKSGKCAYTPFIKNADKTGVCTSVCDTMAPKCTSSQVCTEYTIGGTNICTAKCTSDDECPADIQTPPTAPATWSHLSCDKTTGACTSGGLSNSPLTERPLATRPAGALALSPSASISRSSPRGSPIWLRPRSVLSPPVRASP